MNLRCPVHAIVQTVFFRIKTINRVAPIDKVFGNINVETSRTGAEILSSGSVKIIFFILPYHKRVANINLFFFHIFISPSKYLIKRQFTRDFICNLGRQRLQRKAGLRRHSVKFRHSRVCDNRGDNSLFLGFFRYIEKRLL